MHKSYRFVLKQKLNLQKIILVSILAFQGQAAQINLVNGASFPIQKINIASSSTPYLIALKMVTNYIT